jgi:hypothetical protein
MALVVLCVCTTLLADRGLSWTSTFNVKRTQTSLLQSAAKGTSNLQRTPHTSSFIFMLAITFVLSDSGREHNELHPQRFQDAVVIWNEGTGWWVSEGHVCP